MRFTWIIFLYKVVLRTMFAQTKSGFVWPRQRIEKPQKINMFNLIQWYKIKEEKCWHSVALLLLIANRCELVTNGGNNNTLWWESLGREFGEDKFKCAQLAMEMESNRSGRAFLNLVMRLSPHVAWLPLSQTVIRALLSARCFSKNQGAIKSETRNAKMFKFRI